MIKITVDEAYAFDYLSILEIKKKKNSLIGETYSQIINDISTSIGQENLQKIIDSTEYKNLYESNLLTFEAVDKAKNDLVTASYVDRCNYQRMICKQKLQKKFFSSELSELKIGYEKLSLNE